MTTVLNLKTNDEAVYDLPPEKAVVHAHRQLTLGDYSWWSYDERADTPPIESNGRTVACGDWAALVKKAR